MSPVCTACPAGTAAADGPTPPLAQPPSWRKLRGTVRFLGPPIPAPVASPLPDNAHYSTAPKGPYLGGAITDPIPPAPLRRELPLAGGSALVCLSRGSSHIRVSCLKPQAHGCVRARWATT